MWQVGLIALLFMPGCCHESFRLQPHEKDVPTAVGKTESGEICPHAPVINKCYPL